MCEYEVLRNNDTVAIIYGYSVTDALKRHPQYNTAEYSIIGGWYID